MFETCFFQVPNLHTKGYRTRADFFSLSCRFFCPSQIGLKFVGTSACRTLPDFLSRLIAFSLGAESISAMFEKRLVHVTLMTIPHWLRYARSPTNCLGPPHTSRQGPTRRFEIIARQAPILSQTCLNSPHTSRQVEIFCRPTKNRLECGGLSPVPC